MFLNKKLILSILLSLTMVGCSSETPPEITITQSDSQIDDSMDSSNVAGWWKPIVKTSDGFTYAVLNAPGNRDDGCFSTMSDHYLALVKIDNFASIEHTFAKSSGSYWSHCDDIGHDAPSISVDGSGRIHVFSDLHTDRGWNYFFSSGESELVRSSFIPGNSVYTYPIPKTTTNGDIYLIVRSQPDFFIENSNRKFRGNGLLYHWNNAENRWRLLDTFASTSEITNERLGVSTLAVYPNDIHYDQNGNLHIIWEWSRNTASDERFYQSYLRYNINEDAYYAANGNEMFPPVTPIETSILVGGELTNEVVQSAKVASVPTTGAPLIFIRSKASNEDDFKLSLNTFSDGEWTREDVLLDSDGSTLPSFDIYASAEGIYLYYALTSGNVYVNFRAYGSDNWQINEVFNSSSKTPRISLAASETEHVLYISQPSSEESGTLSIVKLDPAELFN